MARRKTQPNDSLKVREELLAVAARLFASRGFDGTVVQDITDAASVNKAMLYYYFKSKEELYDFLLREAIDRVEDALTVAEKSSLSLEERLRLFLCRYLAATLEAPDLVVLICRELVVVRDGMRAQVLDYFSSTIQRLGTLIVENEEEVRPVDPTIAAFSLFGIVNIFVTRYLLTHRTMEITPLVDGIVDLFMHGVARTGARENH